MKSKTASVRLPKEMYEEIDSICDGIGCTRNDWIKDTLQEKLREESNENSQDQEPKAESKPKEPLRIKIEDVPEPTVEDVPELRNARIVLEPKDVQKPTITLIEKPTIEFNEPKQIDNSRLPPYEMIREIDGKLYPYAKRYET